MVASKAVIKLEASIKSTTSLLCVGLDSDIAKVPDKFKRKRFSQFEFNRWIIEQTHSFVCAYKPNLAFYEARGAAGWQELELTMKYLSQHHPQIFTIADAKRADIGSTNQGYVTAIFDQLGFDAVTLQPYLGQEALRPFLDRADKGCIVLCKTSNSGSGEFQDLVIGGTKSRLWQRVAKQVAEKWNTHHNCMLVVGATYPKELAQVRKIVGEMPILVPGVGEQGGDLKQALKYGLNSHGEGLIINVSRSIIFAKNPQTMAKQLHAQINRYR